LAEYAFNEGVAITQESVRRIFLSLERSAREA
jgi:hypothetical protein